MEKFSLKNRYGLSIIGNIQKPTQLKGLVFLVHGLAGYKEEKSISRIADVFLKNNYTTIVYDATHSRGESDGNYEETTAQKRYDDLYDIVAWAKSQEWYIEPFVLVGLSLGGYVIVKYAEENTSEIKALFPFATTIAGEITVDTMAEFKPEKLKDWKETGWFIHASKSQPGLELKLPWSFIEELLNHDVRPHAERLTMPILFMGGDKDTSCPIKYQKVLYDLVPESTDKEFHVIKDAEHTFYKDEHIEEMAMIVDKWIKKLK